MVRQIHEDEWEFGIYLPHASCVELLGSFNEWEASRAVALIRDDRGWWRSTSRLCAGEYEFCYLVDGGTWLPDYAAGGLRRNAEGRWISQLSIGVDSIDEREIGDEAHGNRSEGEAEPKPLRRTGSIRYSYLRTL